MEYLRDNSWILAVAGIALVTMSLMMRLAKRRRAAGQTLTREERIERVRQQRGLRGDLEDLMVEIEQLAKRLGAQLDAKAVHLERLIDEADQRLAQLRAAGAQATTDSGDGRGAEVEADAGGEPGGDESPPPRQGGVEDKSGDATPADAGQDRLARHVYQLADRGLDPVTIARELNEHVGKVELILALRRA